MKTIDKIPTSKIQRASKLFKTGAKVGVNYIKYYGEKIVRDEDKAKERLNKNNAEDIYDGLKNLKGSALKVAQMLSMDKKHFTRSLCRKIFFITIFCSTSITTFGHKDVQKIFRKKSK